MRILCTFYLLLQQFRYRHQDCRTLCYPKGKSIFIFIENYGRLCIMCFSLCVFSVPLSLLPFLILTVSRHRNDIFHFVYLFHINVSSFRLEMNATSSCKVCRNIEHSHRHGILENVQCKILNS